MSRGSPTAPSHGIGGLPQISAAATSGSRRCPSGTGGRLDHGSSRPRDTSFKAGDPGSIRSCHARSMRRPVLVLVGVLLVLVGAVWTLQGLGYLPGSVMSGVTFWAVVGPVVALLGLVLLVRGLSRSGRGRPPEGGA
jgi:hypothetical protein